jgi:hypothetical protein
VDHWLNATVSLKCPSVAPASGKQSRARKG